MTKVSCDVDSRELTQRAEGLVERTERAVAVGARLAALVGADVDEEGDDAGQHD